MSCECPFKREESMLYCHDEYGPMISDKRYNKCIFISPYRCYEDALENECVGEDNCPIFQKGEITHLLMRRLER